jgi:hypothetical protein
MRNIDFVNCPSGEKLPAREICGRDNWGNGEIIRLEMPYDANSREFTPAIPTSGLAMPALSSYFMMYLYIVTRFLPLYRAKNPSFRTVCIKMSIGPCCEPWPLSAPCSKKEKTKKQE